MARGLLVERPSELATFDTSGSPFLGRRGSSGSPLLGLGAPAAKRNRPWSNVDAHVSPSNWITPSMSELGTEPGVDSFDQRPSFRIQTPWDDVPTYNRHRSGRAPSRR